MNSLDRLYKKNTFKLIHGYLLYFILNTLFASFYSKAANPKIRLVTEHLPPYQLISDKDYSITGFAVDIVLETLKRTPYQYALEGYPWVRSYNLSLKTPNTCIFSIARIASREDKFIWIGQITEQNNAVIWGLKNNVHSQHIKNIDDLKQYVTAVNKNDVTHLGMLEHGLVAGKHLYVLEHTKSLINLLVTRPEIDFIVADDITINYRAKLAGVNINLLQRVFEVKTLPLNFYIACNKQSDPVMIRTLKNKLSEIHQDGTYQKILSRWKSKMPHLK